MDIAEIVKYEQLYTLHIKHPTTNELVGITMKIRSSTSSMSARANSSQSTASSA
jgi:hypothetical protein